MNIELFIARKITTNKRGNKNISQAIIKIAIIAIALSLSVMILSVAIITGFKQEIRNKVIGFGSHIVIQNHDTNSSYETSPIKKNQEFYKTITDIAGIKHIQAFAIKAGIIKTKNDLQGVVLKGVGSDFDWSFFEENIIEGKHFTVIEGEKTTDVIISKYISDLLKLNVGDNLFMYFIQDPPRLRKYKIVGIYNTGLEEFDKLYVFADISDIQKLNEWNKSDEDLVSGFEIIIDDFNNLENLTWEVREEIAYKFDNEGSKLMVNNIKELYPQIFDWLALTDMNVVVILIIMLTVATINMISGLLIIILEKTNMIGILKSVGASNFSIQKIFIYNGVFILGKGLFWGNIIGLSICFIQHFFHIIPLDAASYYVDTVPINVDFWYVLGLNIGTLLITSLIIILPSFIITKIEPIKAIRFN